MTVSEMIAELQKVDPNTQVVMFYDSNSWVPRVYVDSNWRGSGVQVVKIEEVDFA